MKNRIIKTSKKLAVILAWAVCFCPGYILGGDTDEYLEAAEKGDANAQYSLGNCYEYGKGVPKNEVEAAKWYRKAVEQGHEQAKKALDMLINFNPSLEQKKKTNGEDAVTQYSLGEQYEIDQNMTEAFKCYRKAAEQGMAPAQYKVGTFYENGEVVAKDEAEALKWYRKAEEKNNDQARQASMNLIHSNPSLVPIELSDTQKLYLKSAEKGDVKAQLSLADSYYKDGHTNEAIKWYRKAAEQGNAEAQFDFGMRYYSSGHGVDTSIDEALKWFRKAAEQGHAQAQFCIGSCFETGNGVNKDIAEAVKWYRKAADHGYADAQFYIGSSFETGNGVNKNMTEAVKWYRKAAEQGHAQADKRIGVIEQRDARTFYAMGLKFEADNDKAEALRWYRGAAEMGLADAQKKVRELESKR